MRSLIESKIIFKQLLSLLFITVGLFDCREVKVGAQLGASSHTIIFNGKLIAPPKIFQKTNYNFQIRFYDCPGFFGKLNPETGTVSAYKHKDCRNTYSESLFSSSKNNFEKEVIAPKKWTHAYIRLLQTKPIDGLFSPGENPFWFQNNRSLTERVFSHNFDFESTENPISDVEQFMLAEKFSPLIVLKKNKKYIPTNLEKYYQHFKVKTYRGCNPDSELYELIDSQKDDYYEFDPVLYGGDTHVYFHVRPAETFVSGTSPSALPGWRDNRNYRYSKAKGDVVISYYLWFDFNAGPSQRGNRHQGDFESFAVLCGDTGIAKRFMTTGHNHITLDTEWNNINSIDHHPIIYIAHGNKGADGGNPTSAYGGYETSLETRNYFLNELVDPKDIFPDIENAQVIIPKFLHKDKLKNIRIGPGEWIDPKSTKYVDVRKSVSREIAKLVRWEEPAWIGIQAVDDPDKNHKVPEESAFFQNFSGRLGKNPRSRFDVFKLTQRGKSPVNPPFKMNEEQHFTMEKPDRERCEIARVGNYCPKFKGDADTPQFHNH